MGAKPVSSALAAQGQYCPFGQTTDIEPTDTVSPALTLDRQCHFYDCSVTA
jgi:hypothetical protein